MSIQRTRHMAISIGLFERMDDKTLKECFPEQVAEEIRAHLRNLREFGYEYYPQCDDVDEKGLCQGHKGALKA